MASKLTPSSYRIVELKFDKAEVPKFREVKSKNFISFGLNNDYPKYLINLFNESAKHGAIVRGKCNYIFGKGFSANGKINCNGETWNDVLKKCIKDDELFRGYYLQIVWNRAKLINDIYHIDFSKVRVSRRLDSFQVKNDWNDIKEKPRVYPAFNPADPFGSQILYVREYNPFSEFYPLPVYYQGLNYIESDIEVSRHILGNAKKGFVASTLVNLNNGDPINEEHRGEIERGILKKFSGHDSARTVIMFNKSKDNSADIVSLGNSMLTKEDFTNINSLIQQEIFACHQITSPILFGIKTEGQLGGRNEIRDAYEIFTNTYVNERQQEFERVFSSLTEFVGQSVELKIIPVEPLKFTFTESIMTQVLTKNEIREILGREPLEDIPEGAGPEGGEVKIAAEETPQNDALRNLTGRQYQNVMRIVRQYSKGKINSDQAKLLLSRGYGLTDSDINKFLGIEEAVTAEDLKFFDEEDDRMFREFESRGENINDFETFSTDSIGHYFAEFILSQLHYRLMDLIRDFPEGDPVFWSKKLNSEVTQVNRVYSELINAGHVKTEIAAGNKFVVKIEKPLPPPTPDLPKTPSAVVKPTTEGKKKEAGPEPVSYSIRFTYEWRVPEAQQVEKTMRPFCRKMMSLSEAGRTWSMKDIQDISLRLGYSVFDRCGGWWTQPDGTKSPKCRHEWVSRVVTKKT